MFFFCFFFWFQIKVLELIEMRLGSYQFFRLLLNLRTLVVLVKNATSCLTKLNANLFKRYGECPGKNFEDRLG